MAHMIQTTGGPSITCMRARMKSNSPPADRQDYILLHPQSSVDVRYGICAYVVTFSILLKSSNVGQVDKP